MDCRPVSSRGQPTDSKRIKRADDSSSSNRTLCGVVPVSSNTTTVSPDSDETTEADGEILPHSIKFRSIQEDPNASVVYKSLFTTSEQAKNHPKGHWVTYTPLYF
ncbi:unnamed protein product [Protopolystoma xenopodis]|uniref:Uncharacterized protein n=1 Tax=Protopolystoma xenopodis TaxID=117903 RepID=A0A3S5AH41_9PLAT|nr:unnamed protein product [Protopolystoma xenopodis]